MLERLQKNSLSSPTNERLVGDDIGSGLNKTCEMVISEVVNFRVNA